MSAETDLGFNFDPETIELLDAILLNITTDEELNEEFKKLKFIKTLQSKYDGSSGPIRQMMDKMAKIEKTHYQWQKEFARTKMDMKRAIADMTEATRTIRTAAQAGDTIAKYEALKKLEGMEYRQNSYTWNEK